MDDSLTLRLGALHLARRRGRVRDAAWAASRLRLEGVQLEPNDARFAHEMLIRFGHALRVARARAGQPVLTEVPFIAEPVKVLPGRRRRALVVAAVALVVVLLVALIPRSVLEDAGAPEGARPATNVVVLPTAEPLRGRSDSVVAVAPVVVVTPAPSATPSAKPLDVEEPPRGGFQVGFGGGTGTGSGGTGTGSGGTGGGSGTGNGTAQPTPTPTPAPTPTVDEANVMHLSGRVVDSRTGRPVAGVCIAIGVTSCARAPITDSDGIFRVDLTLGQVLAWDLKFLRAGYFTAERLVPSRAGQVFLSDTRIQPTR